MRLSRSSTQATIGDDDVSAAAAQLLSSAAPAMIEDWQSSEPRDWADESFAIAEDAKTGYCEQQEDSCELPPSSHANVDAAYVERNTAIVHERLLKAGVRLAHLLDQAFGD